MVCPGDSIALTASGGIAFEWSTGDTGTNLFATPGGYSVVSIDGNGCRDTSATAVVGEFTPVATLSGDTAFCSLDSARIIASAGTGYTWSHGPTGSNTVYVSQTGSYTVTLTDPNGCLATSDPFTVNNFPNATASIAPTDILTVCPGDSVQLTGGGGTTLEWSNLETGISIWVSTPGDYFVTVSSATTCRDTSDTVSVVHYPTEATITGDSAICSGNVGILTANSGTAYSWSTGALTPSISVGPGDYSVSVTDTFGCTLQSSPFRIVGAGGLSDVTIVPQNPSVTCENDSVTLRAFQLGTVDTVVSQLAGDADEEVNGGDIHRTSDHIKLGKDRWAGVRFRGVTIPGNAIIDAAYIEF